MRFRRDLFFLMQVITMTHTGMQNPQNAGSDVHMGAETVQRPSQRKPKGTVTHPGRGKVAFAFPGAGEDGEGRGRRGSFSGRRLAHTSRQADVCPAPSGVCRTYFCINSSLVYAKTISLMVISQKTQDSVDSHRPGGQMLTRRVSPHGAGSESWSLPRLGHLSPAREGGLLPGSSPSRHDEEMPAAWRPRERP